jgi:hypothetical protein
MKTFFGVLFFIASIRIAQSQNLAKTQKQLQGKWSYVSGSGGFTGKGPGYTKEQKVVFEFQKKGKFQRTEKGKVLTKDSYQLLLPTMVSAGAETFVIKYQNSMEQNAMLKSDTLYLQEAVADGFSYVLVREK